MVLSDGTREATANDRLTRLRSKANAWAGWRHLVRAHTTPLLSSYTVPRRPGVTYPGYGCGATGAGANGTGAIPGSGPSQTPSGGAVDDSGAVSDTVPGGNGGDSPAPGGAPITGTGGAVSEPSGWSVLMAPKSSPTEPN